MDASDPTENLTWYNEEMEDCANGYAAYILEMVEAAKESCADPKVLIEQRVDFSRWVEQGFGTADCIIIADGTLRICDYKHGLGVLVDATDNPQMKCYALGALELFDDILENVWDASSPTTATTTLSRTSETARSSTLTSPWLMRRMPSTGEYQILRFP